MAPIAPNRLKQQSSTSSQQPSKTSNSAPAPAATTTSSSFPFHDDFRTNKRDRRAIKHATFVHRIEKAHAKKPRRRPAKANRLTANLQSLVDSLPDAPAAGPESATGAAGIGAAGVNVTTDQANVIIRHKSIRSKPGALKRKEALDRRERERFARNLAQLSGVRVAVSQTRHGGVADAQASAKSGAEATAAGGTATTITTTQDQAAGPPSTANRWAALRSFIGQTIEQNPEFARRA